ncbi:MAG: HD domain-containing protein [Oscillospiraceae bacterium]|nr:HD domain-containing protein [Oscillospiraceae bacterium]
MFRTEIPEYVKSILFRLKTAGFDSYLVGGCVRDSVMGAVPHDYDIATPASPEAVEACFNDLHVIETGLKHGTVTVVSRGHPVEITTFRSDGEYLDNRRPEHVTFVSDLETDLSRRDFTVNALAYSPDSGIVDLFGGTEDIKAGIIRCVGDPETRFREDGLRILRALRFASRLGFTVDDATDAAIHKCSRLLDNISAERIFSELGGILTGSAAERILTDYSDIMFRIMPELEPMSRTTQNNPHHMYDVWTHTVKSVGAAEPDRILRLAMLFHDCGKPACKTTDDDGIDHFRGHPEVSGRIARVILNRLKSDNRTKDEVLFLVEHHDIQFSPKDNRLKKFIAETGEERFGRLLEVKHADLKARSEYSREVSLPELQRIEGIFREMKASGTCIQVKDLAVNGRDLIKLGVPEGKAVGLMLAQLLDMVVAGEIQNDREQLLAKTRHLSGKFTEM